MMYLNESIEKYLNDSAACIPAPGGGSVSALIGALASAMASMSIHFTVGKQGFEQNTGRLKELLKECEKSREVLTALIQEDVDVYNEVDKTLRMSKITSDEKKFRLESMRRATIFAMMVPLKTAMTCLYVLKLTGELAEITNPNLISEVGVAAILADAGFQCGKINVDINLSHLNNRVIIQKVRNEMHQAEKTAKVYFNEIYKIVQKKLWGEKQAL
ncbi:cyclodeaminase/cyclohydrolase family protein [Candidatus Kuenenia sp.]|uniref:cyclodeaminase/cyclohydrolase family protein n=1 Tax=Candidatus Kuenenia sp. TaxID=2499824 RepID=UPI00321FE5BA